MLLRRPSYRKFEYLPRFFNPEKDTDMKRREKMRLSRSQNRRKVKPAFFWGILFVLAVYMYFYLTGAFR